MSLIYSKEQDGTLSMLLCGKIARDPERKSTKSGDKIRFSVCYGKSKFMDCEAWADSAAGEMVGYMEKGDPVMVMGTHRKWDYNGKEYQSVDCDGVFPMTLPIAETVGSISAGTKPTEDRSASTFSELTEDDSELPF